MYNHNKVALPACKPRYVKLTQSSHEELTEQYWIDSEKSTWKYEFIVSYEQHRHLKTSLLTDREKTRLPLRILKHKFPEFQVAQDNTRVVTMCNRTDDLMK